MEQGDSVLIAGGTGLVGRRLTQLLNQNGYKVMLLSRKKTAEDNTQTFEWNPAKNEIDNSALLEADHIINLSGENIAGGRWTAERKNALISSRTQSSILLFDACNRLGRFPKTYISASAIGYYGNRNSEILDEDSEPGTGFLSECCVAWEAGVQKWSDAGVRTVICRIGLVLTADGGVLAETLKPMRLGLATFFGTGKQYNSWIHIDDLCGILQMAIEDDEMNGTFNAVAPNPVSNIEFTRTLLKVRKKPGLLVPAPSYALHLLLGEAAQMVLSGSIVSSAKIEQQGYVFQFTELEAALSDLL
jgi:uncharacterized protein (TIGR01777 family)